MSILLYKEVGETPLEALERVRIAQGITLNMPMTYAGRLDPMAEGALLILVGDECKRKESFLGADKEYEIEVLFGITTDTGDVLGLIKKVENETKDTMEIRNVANINSQSGQQPDKWQKFVGKFEQKYPAYSSKTVGGKQLHNLARKGELPDEMDMPSKNIEIYSIEELEYREILGNEIAEQAIKNISKVHGDFRQKEIVEGWHAFSKVHSMNTFFVVKLRVNCSSGTYMRSLAERIGKEAGTVAVAISIIRTKICDLYI